MMAFEFPWSLEFPWDYGIPIEDLYKYEASSCCAENIKENGQKVTPADMQVTIVENGMLCDSISGGAAASHHIRVPQKQLKVWRIMFMRPSLRPFREICLLGTDKERGPHRHAYQYNIKYTTTLRL
jgi:hypothetical protein